jgi:DNA helicase II / ATP-dependent DNA helicase PcrA
MPPADLPQPPARLSAGQREAILAPDGPLLITAGPGTGKTLTVAERIAHLVTTERAALTEILALTFSRVAARTLTTRLATRLGRAGTAIHATTFHAFGLWRARRWPRALGYAGPDLDGYGERAARARLLAGERGHLTVGGDACQNVYA